MEVGQKMVSVTQLSRLIQINVTYHLCRKYPYTIDNLVDSVFEPARTIQNHLQT